MITTTIGDYCPFKYGKTLSAAKRISGPIPVYGSNGRVGFHNHPCVDTHGIIIGRKGTAGAVHICKSAFWPIDTTYFVVKENYFETVYTYYLLKSLNLEGMNTDSAVPGLNRKNAHAIKIKILKNLNDRVNVGRYISLFDDKIENNQKMNETLEAMMRAIFKSWFSDFDPVYAKIAGEQPIYMDTITADLFPCSISNKGLPNGWSIDNLTKYATLNSNSFTTRNLPEEIYYIDLRSTKNGEILRTRIHTRDDAPGRARRILNEGDTIVGTVEPTNRSFAYIGKLTFPITASTGFAVLTPTRKEYSEFIYCAVSEDKNINRLSQLAEGTTYPTVRPKFVIETPVPNAGDEIVFAFHKQVANLMKRVVQNREENKTLVKLRDTFLPKLMSGQLQIPDIKVSFKEETN